MNRSLSILCLWVIGSASFAAPASDSLRRKLESVQLKEVRYDSLTLHQVARDLRESVKGVHFLVRNGAGIKTENVLVNIGLPLFDLTLKETLDVIALTCDQPVEYVLEKDTIVFRPDQKARPNVRKPVPVRPDSKAAMILAKLSQITVPEVYYNELALDTAMQDVREQTWRQGHVNFLMLHEPAINGRLPEGADRAPLIVLSSGAGVVLNETSTNMTTFMGACAAAPAGHVYESVIRMGLPPFDLTLKETLDLLVELADMPIQYSVRDYGVTIESVYREITPISLAIEVDSQRVLAKLEALAGEPLPKQRLLLSRRLQSYFAATGIECMATRAFGARVFFDTENDRIRIHAIEEELPKIKKVIQRLNSP